MQNADTDRDHIPLAEQGQISRLRGLRFIAAAVSLCIFLSFHTMPAGACGEAPLTNSFSTDPCSLPQPTTPPGTQFQQYLQSWTTGQWLTNLQAMTAQLYAYRVWETWDLGIMLDAQDTLHNARMQQEQRLTTKQDTYPNDQTCTAGSSVVPETQTAVTAAALTQGFKQDILRRAHNASEQAQKDGSYIIPGIPSANDLYNRWDTFCQEFYDPNSNDAQGGCNTSSAGPVMNDDISVESFLLRDTIDMNNLDEYKASQAILVNIIQPDVPDNVPDAVLKTTPGQEYVLRMQHLEAIRNIAADVVGGILSRRASIAQTNSNLVTQISAIRKQAGVPACPASPKTATGPCYSTTPSYNEIMLAMTKERFFDPAYFADMEANKGTIQQEQDAIDGYTTVQMQDIYKMQEQINALLAARASLKMSIDAAGSQTPSAPNQ